MAAQTPNAPAGRPAKKDETPKKSIKNPVVYAGAVVLTVFIIVAFVFVPSGAGGGAGEAIQFGSYAGKPIVYTPGNYLAQQVQSINDNLRKQGLTDENYQFLSYQVWRGAFERTVVRDAVLAEVRAAGGRVTETRLDERMTEHPSFMEEGKFSARRYREATMAEKLAIREGLRDDLMAEYYYSDIFGLNPNSKEIAFVKAMGKETRTVEYAAFPLSAFPDSETAAWAKENPALFRRVPLSRITVSSSEQDALKVLKSVKDGSVAFAEAAKSHSKDSWADKGGELGSRFFYEIQGDLEKKEDADKVVALKKGELSPILKTASGSWTFFRADADVADADLGDPAVISAVKAYMNRYERGRIEDWSAAKAKAFASEAAQDFKKAAQSAGVEAKTLGPFPLNYGDLQVSIYGQTIPILRSLNDGTRPELAAASTSEKFLTAAFGLAPGAVSEPIVLGEQVLVLRVKEAGSALDEELSSLPLYFPFFYQQKTDMEVREVFMKSPKLKDSFMDAYLKYFSPKNT